VPDLLPRHAPSAGAAMLRAEGRAEPAFRGRPLSAPREYSRCRARQRVADGNPPLMYLGKVKEVQFETHFDRLRKPVKPAGSPLPSQTSGGKAPIRGTADQPKGPEGWCFAARRGWSRPHPGERSKSAIWTVAFPNRAIQKAPNWGLFLFRPPPVITGSQAALSGGGLR
jgi:hypothetical protein